MTITLLPVDAVDPDVIRKLDVHESQMDFIASNEESLEELAERPECVGFAVMIEGAPIGFAMYALDPDDGNHWIYRLMIDARHQGKGYLPRRLPPCWNIWPASPNAATSISASTRKTPAPTPFITASVSARPA